MKTIYFSSYAQLPFLRRPGPLLKNGVTHSSLGSCTKLALKKMLHNLGCSPQPYGKVLSLKIPLMYGIKCGEVEQFPTWKLPPW